MHKPIPAIIHNRPMTGQVIAFPVGKDAPRIVFGRALIHRLAERAAELTDASLAELLGRCKLWRVAWVRFAVMLVAREHGKSTTQIGHVLGGMDHTSVLHGSARAIEIAAEDPDYARLIALLRAEASQ